MDALLYALWKKLFCIVTEPGSVICSLCTPPRSAKKLERTSLNDLRLPATHRATAVAGYPAIITDTDITVLTIGHSYRNAAYHRDAHNPAVLVIIGKRFFESATNLFVSSQHPGVGSWITQGQADRLRLIGIDLGNGRPGHKVLHYRDAAIDLAAKLNDGMSVATDQLAHELAEDLNFRIQEVKEGIDYLREAPGDIHEHLEWVDYWATQRADKELSRLKDARDAFVHKLRNLAVEQVSPEMREEEAKLTNAYNKRFWELWQARGAATKGSIIDSLHSIERLAGRLSIKRSPALILREYRQADKRLSTIELHISEAITAYESQIP